jgi:hypothetical protein
MEIENITVYNKIKIKYDLTDSRLEELRDNIFNISQFNDILLSVRSKQDQIRLICEITNSTKSNEIQFITDLVNNIICFN